MTVLERLEEMERYKRLGQDTTYAQMCRRELIDNALPHLIAVAEAAQSIVASNANAGPGWRAIADALAELTKGAGDER